MKYENIQQINSSILKYIDINQGGSPFLFKKKWDEMTEERIDEQKSYQIYGTALHCYLLENDKFEQRYFVSQLEEEKKYNKLKEYLKFNIDFDILCEKLCTEYVEKKDVKKEETKIKHYNEHLEFLKQYENYYNELVVNKNKIEISSLDFEKIVKTYINVYSHYFAKDLFEIESENELEIIDIELPISDKKLKCKIDKLIKSKDIILDIKTTSKSVYQFEKSFNDYQYGLQAAFYCMCCNLPNFNRNFYFLVCSSFDSSVAIYKISNDLLNLYTNKICDLLEEINWQFKNKEFKYFSWESKNSIKEL